MEIGNINNMSTINKVSYSNPLDKISKASSNADNNKSLNNIGQVKIDEKEVKSAVDKANKVLFKNNTHLQFSIHEKTKDLMVKIVDNDTGDVLKEIPPEKLLDMVAKIWEIAGIFIDEKR